MEEEIAQLKKEFQETIDNLQSKVNDLSRKLETHKHTGIDMTSKIDGTLELKDQSQIQIGNSGITAITRGSANYQLFVSGSDTSQGFANTTGNTQLTLENQTSNSFYYGFRPPLYSRTGGISITSAGNTLTDTGFAWTTNILAGAYINTYDSSNALKDTRVIASNTANQITITGTWSFTDSNSSYIVFIPVYLGSADYPWRRVYTGEGTGEGIRFGYGATNAGTNGLLYMDATGDLYWRNKAGTPIKLN